jgi:hypothetical protein
MEFYLQFGYGMMEHCRTLIASWGGGTVIMSPRDLNSGQLTKLSQNIRKIPDGLVLLDPQFYLPRGDHERLCSHDYWPNDFETGAFWLGPSLKRLLTKLENLNGLLGCQEFILPGLLADTIDDDWLAVQTLILEEARALDSHIPLLMTIALSGEAVKNQDQIALLLERASTWKADGYYIVCEHPNGEYLVEDPNWLANVLDLVAGLRLNNSRTILGYCNHQMLAAATVKATAIASGTWMNVRSFPPDKFRVSYDEEIKQRATWYYCPQALSEYKIPFLDIAHRQGVLDSMKPFSPLDTSVTAPLFGGSQPTTVGFTEQAAFRHYLNSLRFQARSAGGSTFDETLSIHEDALSQAETLLSQLNATGIRGQKRDFSDIVDVNRAALSVIGTTRGSILRRKWASL